jgi:hypothetical protein
MKCRRSSDVQGITCSLVSLASAGSVVPCLGLSGAECQPEQESCTPEPGLQYAVAPPAVGPISPPPRCLSKEEMVAGLAQANVLLSTLEVPGQPGMHGPLAMHAIRRPGAWFGSLSQCPAALFAWLQRASPSSRSMRAATFCALHAVSLACPPCPAPNAVPDLTLHGQVQLA